MSKKENEREYWIKRRDRDQKRIEEIKSELGHMDIQREGKAVIDQLGFEQEYDKLHSELKELEGDVVLCEAEIEKGKSFDKKTFLKNFRYLLNKSETKIGDIEREAGVTTGYVSRLESGKIAADPTVEFVLTAARMLNTSVEVLVNGDFSTLSPTEEYVSKVLNNLIEDTQTDRITWYKESIFDLSSVGSDYNGDAEHPLFRGTFSGDGVPRGGEYYSRFVESDNLEIAGSFYHAKLPMTDQKIYITSLKEDLFGHEVHYFEIYLVDGHDNVKPVCADSVCCDRLKKEIAMLYKEIELASSHLHIDDSVRDIFNLYMEKLPFD